MKKINILLSLLVVLTSCSGTTQNTLKRYEIKSGIVEYTTTISGEVMGSKISGSGTENLFFKNWGAVELKEEQSSQTTTSKIFGKTSTETTSTHVINKLDNGESYLADFDKKIIYAGRDPLMDMFKQTSTDVGDAGKNMLESVGGKKIGTESFLGYDCDVWDISGAKQWMYKGVVLKLDMTVFGITTITQATSAKFDVSVSDSNFELPDFPIQKQEGFMNNLEFENEMDATNENMEMLSKLSFEEWKKMATENDPEMQAMSDEELRETYDMVQKMLKMRNSN